ncbi:hypothetical protein Tco_1448578 [Tanacetum coccineum]
MSFRGSSEERLSNEEFKWVRLVGRGECLYDFKGFDGGSVQLGDNSQCTIKGIEKVKIQLRDGSSFILEDVRIRKKNCVYALETKVTTFGVQKHGDSKQVEFKQLGSKQVGFKYLGVKQVGFKQLGPSVETGVHVAQKRLEDKQLEENTNTDCLVKEQEKLHLGIKERANIMVTRVHGKEDAEGNVAEKKKVKESRKANLGKLLKYNAWPHLTFDVQPQFPTTDLRGDQGLYGSKNSTRNHAFAGYPFDYCVTLGFGSIAGGLDHVNPVIRLPLKHGISRVLGKDDVGNP